MAGRRYEPWRDAPETSGSTTIPCYPNIPPLKECGLVPEDKRFEALCDRFDEARAHFKHKLNCMKESDEKTMIESIWHRCSKVLFWPHKFWGTGKVWEIDLKKELSRCDPDTFLLFLDMVERLLPRGDEVEVWNRNMRNGCFRDTEHIMILSVWFENHPTGNSPPDPAFLKSPDCRNRIIDIYKSYWPAEGGAEFRVLLRNLLHWQEYFKDDFKFTSFIEAHADWGTLTWYRNDIEKYIQLPVDRDKTNHPLFRPVKATLLHWTGQRKELFIAANMPGRIHSFLTENKRSDLAVRELDRVSYVATEEVEYVIVRAVGIVLREDIFMKDTGLTQFFRPNQFFASHEIIRNNVVKSGPKDSQFPTATPTKLEIVGNMLVIGFDDNGYYTDITSNQVDWYVEALFYPCYQRSEFDKEHSALMID